MNRVGLVACSASKGPIACSARDLYTSALFQKSRKYVEARCDRWFILSALHGVVDPLAVLFPYDHTLSTDTTARRAWCDLVIKQLHFLGQSQHITILAGLRYREFLVPQLRALSHNIVTPLEGMRIGEQLRFLSRCEPW